MTKLQLITSNLVSHLQKLTVNSTSIAWITAFAMESGVKLILPTLKQAHDRGIEIKILVGDYLYITQPKALQLLVENLPNAEIRLYQSRGISFHPKAYLFRQLETQHVIVGSSNLSASALKQGIEWNLHAPSTVSETIFDEAMEQFSQVFYASQTIAIHKESVAVYAEKYEAANVVTPLSTRWDDKEAQEVMFGTTAPNHVMEEEIPYNVAITPRPAQQLALAALDETLEEGYDKALVVLATGLGKTYLSAFFAEQYPRVLFIAHRDEILQQAAKAFRTVYCDKTIGFYNAQEKNLHAELLFASIHTLSQAYHLEKFKLDAFDLIIVDEFHHAVAKSYERAINHFKPQFLLGITATPDRLDNQDVYSVCDGNVAIRIHFLDAIQRGWLAPFQYYGVKDKIDYTQIRWLGTGYEDEALRVAQLKEDVAQQILQAWQKHKQSRSIGFCSTVRQAQFLADFFTSEGYRAIALSGMTAKQLRTDARKQLERGEIDIIFTVDLFNEGVDIPTVDTLLFVRPTESLAIFTQQIGRGLRLAEGKDVCTIIDMIGNYRNADRKLAVFVAEPEQGYKVTAINDYLPTDCAIHLEIDVINLIEEMARKTATYKQQFVMEFERLKLDIGRRPTYLELHLQSYIPSNKIKQEFGSYVGLLQVAGDLSLEEQAIYRDYQTWLEEVEKTAMTKSYKMVLLGAMLARGMHDWYKPITAEEVAPFFVNYLTEKPYRAAIDKIDVDVKKVKSLIERMPMTKWSGSSKGLVTFEDKVFGLGFDVAEEAAEVLYEWTREICAYRLHWYFERKQGEVK
ncbi:MAG: DEAD/DEAH box helicase family protein [Lysinibacillus sp.]